MEGPLEMHRVLVALPYGSTFPLMLEPIVKLNRLEAQAMAKVILTLNPDTAYVDASDVSEERYGEYISDLLPSNIEVISKHKADKIFELR